MKNGIGMGSPHARTKPRRRRGFVRTAYGTNLFPVNLLLTVASRLIRLELQTTTTGNTGEKALETRDPKSVNALVIRRQEVKGAFDDRAKTFDTCLKGFRSAIGTPTTIHESSSRALVTTTRTTWEEESGGESIRGSGSTASAVTTGIPSSRRH